MVRFICQLPEKTQEKIRVKVIDYLEKIETGLAYKVDDLGYSNINNIMNDTICNLEGTGILEELKIY